MEFWLKVSEFSKISYFTYIRCFAVSWGDTIPPYSVGIITCPKVGLRHVDEPMCIEIKYVT